MLGLFVDAAHEQLYAVSTNGFLDEAQRQRRNAILDYDLKKDLLVNRYDAPDANQLNDLTVATDGTIYATDSASGTLFRKRAARENAHAIRTQECAPRCKRHHSLCGG